MVGTELTNLLALFGITYTPGCPCNDYARLLNNRGVLWAKANVPVIVGWLRAEAARRKLLYSDLAATAIVRLAIWRAGRKRP